MRTTIALDDVMLAELMQAEPGVSRSEAIRRAIQSHLRRRREAEFMRLAGSGLVDLDWRVAERQELNETRRGRTTSRKRRAQR